MKKDYVLVSLPTKKWGFKNVEGQQKGNREEEGEPTTPRKVTSQAGQGHCCQRGRDCLFKANYLTC